jgi:hypothetical protein
MSRKTGLDLLRRKIMKKAMVVLAILFLSSMVAQAQTGGGMMGEQKGQAGTGMMPCEKEHVPMMQQMMGHGMMPQGTMMRGTAGDIAFAESNKEEQPGGPKKAQEKTEAGVTAKVSLENMNGASTFKITLETHTVDLEKYKFDEIVVLRVAGREYKGRIVSQEGSGHHRSAVLEFDNPQAKEMEIVIKGVADVKERVFTF